jgi:hypothetical protein
MAVSRPSSSGTSRPSAAAAAAASWVSPDLSTWSELSGASYDHAGSSWSSNGGTMRISATHGYPDAGLDAGGIVSADLGLTFANVLAIVVELVIGVIPTSETGVRGVGVALLNTNSLESGKGVVMAPARLSGGNYQLHSWKVGSSASTAAGITGPWGTVSVPFPFTEDGPAAGMMGAKGASLVRVLDSPSLTAFDTGCRIGLFALRATTGSSVIDVPVTSIRYQVITA